MNPTISEMFKALGHEKRWLILQACSASKDGQTNLNLEIMLEAAGPVISNHITWLVAAGLLNRRQSGKYAILTVNPDALKTMLSALLTVHETTIRTKGQADADSRRLESQPPQVTPVWPAGLREDVAGVDPGGERNDL